MAVVDAPGTAPFGASRWSRRAPRRTMAIRSRYIGNGGAQPSSGPGFVIAVGPVLDDLAVDNTEPVRLGRVELAPGRWERLPRSRILAEQHEGERLVAGRAPGHAQPVCPPARPALTHRGSNDRSAGQAKVVHHPAGERLALSHAHGGRATSDMHRTGTVRKHAIAMRLATARGELRHRAGVPFPC